jgi:hypothetical protein
VGQLGAGRLTSGDDVFKQGMPCAIASVAMLSVANAVTGNYDFHRDHSGNHFTSKGPTSDKGFAIGPVNSTDHSKGFFDLSLLKRENKVDLHYNSLGPFIWKDEHQKSKSGSRRHPTTHKPKHGPKENSMPAGHPDIPPGCHIPLRAGC